MGITNQDWMEQPSIDEQLIQNISYLEMGGIKFSGISSGTFSAFMACAPGGAPSYRGGTERTQGLALTGQGQLNRIVRNLFAFKNYRFQGIEMPLTGKYTNLDIAPQEPVNIIIEPGDTVRRVNIRNDFNVNSMSWEYNAKDALLLPRVRWKPIVNGNHVEVISIPDTPDAGGYNTPPIQVPNVPSIGFPASYGSLIGSFGANQYISMVINSNSNFVGPFNFDSIDQVRGSIFSWTSGNKVFCSSPGLFMFIFQTSCTMKTPEGAVSFAARVQQTSNNVTLQTLSYQARNFLASTTWPSTVPASVLLAQVDVPFYVNLVLVSSATTISSWSVGIQIVRLSP
jgi:hypothetical protein